MAQGHALFGQASTQVNAIPPPPEHQGAHDLALWREYYQEAWDGRYHTRYEWAAWNYLETLRGAHTLREFRGFQGFPGDFRGFQGFRVSGVQGSRYVLFIISQVVPGVFQVVQGPQKA